MGQEPKVNPLLQDWNVNHKAGEDEGGQVKGTSEGGVGLSYLHLCSYRRDVTGKGDQVCMDAEGLVMCSLP